MFRLARPFAVFLLVVILCQWLTGVYGKLLDGSHDEASHYLTSLLVRDYLAGGLSWHPLRYAENYYLHYPKIALGHWPPVFYLLNGLWLLAFPFGSGSLFALLAVTTAGLTTRIFLYVKRDAPEWAAWLVGLLFLTLSPVYSSFIQLMSELVLAWLVLEAWLAFSRWMQAPTIARGVGFSLWSSLALLTKALGAGLAFLPPAALLLASRRNLLLKPSLILSGCLVAAAVAPWYFLAPGARHEASGHKFAGLLGVNPPARVASDAAEQRGLPIHLTELAYRAERSLRAVPLLFRWLGPVLLLSLLGIWRSARLGDADALAVAGLLLAYLVFRFVLVSAAWEPRMLIPLLAPCLCFVWAGRAYFSFPHASAVLAALLICTGGYNLHAGHRPVGHPAGEAAAWIASSSSAKYPAILVSGSGALEGSITAAVADCDRQRPSRYVVRASKLLSVSSWASDVYLPKANTEDEVLRSLDSVPIDLVVLSPLTPRSMPHSVLLDHTVRANPGRFRRVQLRDQSLEIYEMVRREDAPPNSAPKIDMFLFGLGRSLSTQ
ncbi:ArnT family glycosyltransferase [Paludibaculum fermentans]|uniref:ArnT family glycosyltransferase n=1 Tax=Paludibaculum fermentans TaxID=1473598 RepID=UPI003EBB8019